MHRLLLSTLILPALAALSAIDASAQGRVTVTYSSHSSTDRANMVDLEAYVLEALDVMPEFPGGENAMVRFINNERVYPSQAYKSGIEGRVLCSFIIEADGQLTNIEVVRGVEESLDREAVRVIRKMPRWKPGYVAGTTVPVYYMLPIAFRH